MNFAGALLAFAIAVTLVSVVAAIVLGVLLSDGWTRDSDTRLWPLVIVAFVSGATLIGYAATLLSQ